MPTSSSSLAPSSSSSPYQTASYTNLLSPKVKKFKTTKRMDVVVSSDSDEPLHSLKHKSQSNGLDFSVFDKGGAAKEKSIPDSSDDADRATKRRAVSGGGDSDSESSDLLSYVKSQSKAKKADGNGLPDKIDSEMLKPGAKPNRNTRLTMKQKKDLEDAKKQQAAADMKRMRNKRRFE
jgi:hypothetical protein